MPAPPPDNEALILRDGTRLEIKPLEAADRDELRVAIENLSPESRYRRFLSPTGGLSARELTYLTTIDHERHEALAAVDPATGTGVAVARYVVFDEAPARAEIAVTVADAWQGRGVGSGLLRRLAQLARARGIAQFSGLMLATNTPMIRLLSSLGTVSSRRQGTGTLELVVDLPDDPAAYASAVGRP